MNENQFYFDLFVKNLEANGGIRGEDMKSPTAIFNKLGRIISDDNFDKEEHFIVVAKSIKVNFNEFANPANFSKLVISGAYFHMYQIIQPEYKVKLGEKLKIMTTDFNVIEREAIQADVDATEHVLVRFGTCS